MRQLLICLLTSFLTIPCFAAENLFYMLRSTATDRICTPEEAFNSLTQHYSSIDSLIAQAYRTNENGDFLGNVDQQTLQFARAHKMKITVLVTNVGFDKTKVHLFLMNPTAQKRFIDALVNACVENHFYGVQLDLEMVPLADKDLLTKFYIDTTDALHAKGLIVSYAVAPVVDDNPKNSLFLKKIYSNWEGAYDLKALGKHGDFISIMAYNQHGGATTPGSTASLAWVKKSLQYALQFVPAKKISLGIPAYSNYWYTGSSDAKHIHVFQAGIPFAKADAIIKRNHANLTWNNTDKVHYTMYQRNWLNEYVFLEDTKSFKAKMDLVHEFHLRGVSVFDLGSEDPRIWQLLS